MVFLYKEHLIVTLGQNDLGGEDGLERKVSLNTSQHHIQNHDSDSSIHRLILALTIDEIPNNIYYLHLLYIYHLPDKLRWFHCHCISPNSDCGNLVSYKT